MELKLAMDKAAAGKRGLIVHGHYLAKSSGTRVVFCPACKAPVVNSPEGRGGHFERMPECKTSW